MNRRQFLLFSDHISSESHQLRWASCWQLACEINFFLLMPKTENSNKCVLSQAKLPKKHPPSLSPRSAIVKASDIPSSSRVRCCLQVVSRLILRFQYQITQHPSLCLPSFCDVLPLLFLQKQFCWLIWSEHCHFYEQHTKCETYCDWRHSIVH